MSKRRFTPHEREIAKIDALNLRLRGETYRSIAASLSTCAETARTLYHDALDDMRPHEEFDVYRARQLAELRTVRELVMRGAFEHAQKASVDPYKVRTLADSLVSLHDREARLTGIDRAAVTSEATGETDVQVGEQVVQAFQAYLEGAAAAARSERS